MTVFIWTVYQTSSPLGCEWLLPLSFISFPSSPFLAIALSLSFKRGVRKLGSGVKFVVTWFTWQSPTCWSVSWRPFSTLTSSLATGTTSYGGARWCSFWSCLQSLFHHSFCHSLQLSGKFCLVKKLNFDFYVFHFAKLSCCEEYHLSLLSPAGVSSSTSSTNCLGAGHSLCLCAEQHSISVLCRWRAHLRRMCPTEWPQWPGTPGTGFCQPHIHVHHS